MSDHYPESLFLAQSAHEEATSLASSLVSPGLLIFFLVSSTTFAIATGISTAIAIATQSRSRRMETLLAIIIILIFVLSFLVLLNPPPRYSQQDSDQMPAFLLSSL